MPEYAGNLKRAPFFDKGSYTVHDELLASTGSGWTQKGVTLKPGQGVLLLGTLLAYETTSKRYVKYASGGANGTGTGVGLLRETVDTGAAGETAEYQNNVVLTGTVFASKVSAANGGAAGLTAAATALGGRVVAVKDLLIF